MPAYVAGTATALYPGDKLILVNAESVTAGYKSQAFARATGPAGALAQSTFAVLWAAAPTAVLVVEVAIEDNDTEYQTIFTNTNTQKDNYTDDANWMFYRIRVVSISAGGALTVKVQR